MADVIAQEDEHDETPTGMAKRLATEFAAAKESLRKFQEQGAKVVARFLDDREFDGSTETRLNLFTSNTQTQRSIMYGQTPKASVTRKFADAQDDVGRVAAEMVERLLNHDIERASDTYAEAIGLAMQDRQLPGLGMVRNRYVAEFETVQVEPVIEPMSGGELAPGYTEERKVREDVEVLYMHWTDVLWSPCRVPSEMRWAAFRNQMSKEQLRSRFGDIGGLVPMNAKSSTDPEDPKKANPWQRADVWEVWDKEHGQVYWYVEGFDKTLDCKKDPLGLEGFWPFPRPMMANLTTRALVPKADYVLVQDIYKSIDNLSTRIDLLEKALRVAGVYDKSNTDLPKLVDGRASNILIPAENWAAFSEKGGVKGAVDWMPLEQIVGALSALRDLRREKIDLAYQITGMSDIMRGQATQAGVTASEQLLKAKFGSVRMQSLQDEFARFASDALRIKAEIIRKHFDPQTIVERSNIMMTPDAQLAEAAVRLIKSDKFDVRIEVKPEAIALMDFAQLKSERSEVLMSIASFFSAMGPVLPAFGPGGMPLMLQLLQANVAGLRGASTMESILDSAIAQAEAAAEAAAQNPQGPPPDPKLAIENLKAQAKLVQIDAETRARLAELGAEVQADAAREANQRRENVMEAASKAAISHSYKSLDGGNGHSGGYVP